MYIGTSILGYINEINAKGIIETSSCYTKIGDSLGSGSTRYITRQGNKSTRIIHYQAWNIVHTYKIIYIVKSLTNSKLL